MSDTDREEAILTVARSYADDHGGPGLVRQHFLRVVGRPDTEPTRLIEFDASRLRSGTLGVTVWVRSALDLDRVMRSLGQPAHDAPPAHDHPAREVARRLVRGYRRHLHQSERRRARYRASSAVARALAIHYLSRQGGGSCTLERAAQRTEEAGVDVPDHWRAERERILRQLREEFGPL